MRQIAYMLDTNAVSAIIRGKSANIERAVGKAGLENLCISVITQAEILFGLARKPEATKIAQSANSILPLLTTLDWGSREAQVHAVMRARLEVDGTPIALFDSLIAAHALSIGCTLVTADRAFSMVPNLATVNWEA